MCSGDKALCSGFSFRTWHRRPSCTHRPDNTFLAGWGSLHTIYTSLNQSQAAFSVQAACFRRPFFLRSYKTMKTKMNRKKRTMMWRFTLWCFWSLPSMCLGTQDPSWASSRSLGRPLLFLLLLFFLLCFIILKSFKKRLTF